MELHGHKRFFVLFFNFIASIPLISRGFLSVL